MSSQIVTGYLDSAARNLGHTEQPQVSAHLHMCKLSSIAGLMLCLKHADRYKVAEEYVSVMYKLFESSWRDDAVVLDPKRGVYTSPDRVREINHVGEFFNVPGPHICQPSPKRTPLLLQAGTSKAGKTFAAQHAEAVFVAGHSPSVVAKNIAEIRHLAKTKFGRNPQSIKFLAMFCPVLGFDDYRKYGSTEGALALFGGWTGIDLGKYGDDEELRHVESNAIKYASTTPQFMARCSILILNRSAVEAWSHSSPGVKKWTKHTVAAHITVGGLGATTCGTPAQVADEMERWVEEADVDGFNMVSFDSPVPSELRVPSLRRKIFFFPISSLTTFPSPTPYFHPLLRTSSNCCYRSYGLVDFFGPTTLYPVERTAKTSTAKKVRAGPYRSTLLLVIDGERAWERKIIASRMGSDAREVQVSFCI
jgi:alkanesulfonate monooxygenase SsuD/methylene tetrahydromethanopterin reductase-like flavin-dependent oxidoreductase (luciferase family)